ncbi:RNA polymerase rpb1 c-terminal repeat domain protein [Seiridium cupressi]
MRLKSFKEHMLTKMADSKNKPLANGAHKTVKSPNKLLALVACAKDVVADLDGIESLAGLIEEKKQLQQMLETKTTTRSSNLKQLRNFDRERSELEARSQDASQLKAQRGEAKRRGREQHDKIDLLKKDLGNVKTLRDMNEARSKRMEKERNVIQAKFNARDAECEDLDSQLREAKADLSHGVFRPLNQADLASLTKKIASANVLFFAPPKFHPCQRTPPQAFGTFLLNPINANLYQYNNITPASLRERFKVLPLPKSQSNESALMRRAAAESVIAQALVNYVLRPFYAPCLDININAQEAAECVFGLFGRDKSCQSVFRCQLLKLAKDRESDVIDEVVQVATVSVLTILGQYVSSNRAEQFEDRVTGLFEEFAELWSTQIQYYEDLILADLPGEDSVHLGSRTEYGSIPDTKIPEGAKRAIELVLFPRIYVSLKGPVLQRGVVLWADQSIVVTARDQVEREKLKNSSRRQSNTGVRNFRQTNGL